jgi:rhodanese-related sulfurtransferase
MSSGEIPTVRADDVDTTTIPVIDARSHPSKEQIRGALRYDAAALLREEVLVLPLPHDGRIVVYADDEERARAVALRLRERGYARAAVLAGGFEAYRDAGLATEPLTQEQPVPGAQGTGIPRA